MVSLVSAAAMEAYDLIWPAHDVREMRMWVGNGMTDIYVMTNTLPSSR